MLPEHLFPVPLTGRSYRPMFRYFTLSTVMSLATYGTWVLSRRSDVAPTILLLLAVAAVVVLAHGWYILTGRTTVDSHGVHQDWPFRKSYRWGEIMRARVVRLPGSVRLVISTGSGPMKAIHSGCRELDAAFERIAAFYRAP